MILEKACTKCGEVKPITEFAKNQSTNTGGDVYRRPECKACTKKEGQGKRLAYKMAGKPSVPEVGTCCDLCGEAPLPPTKEGAKPKKLVFDHGHVSFRHRGWLCDNCNRSLGMLGDDELGMVKALLYIAEGENRSKEVIEKIQDLLNVIVQIGEPDKMVLMEQHG